MTLQERITKLQEELQICNANCAQWNEARLKTEGALFYLRKIAEEESLTSQADAEQTTPTDPVIQ